MVYEVILQENGSRFFNRPFFGELQDIQASSSNW